jgi:RNA polymerase sigma-70 factor (ECF subfamily)
MTDRELIDGIRSCDAKVAEHLLATYWEPLIRYADGILEGAADAQDVVQDVFLRLWSHRERWSSVGSVRALLYTVTRNAALDERRRRVREGQASHDADIPFSGPSPSDEALTAEIQRAAAVAVSGLPPKRQEVFRLVREEGLTHKEVAAVMGISTQTVANQMSKALAELRSALEPYIDLDPQGRGEAE